MWVFPTSLCVRHWVITHIKTQEKKAPPDADLYEFEFSEDGANAMIMGIAAGGDEFFQSDSEVFTKFIHYSGEHAYLFDLQSGNKLQLGDGHGEE